MVKKQSIIEKIKNEPGRVLATYSFPAILLKEFKSKCKKEGVPQSKVLQALVRDFLNQ